MAKFSRAYRYNNRYENLSAEYLKYVRQDLLQVLLMDELAPLLAKENRFFSVKLEQNTSPVQMGLYTEIILSLTVNPSEERIIETKWVDYRPMNWHTLSHTAIQEIRSRLRSWWRRPFSTRLYLFHVSMDVFEGRHFGRAFDRKGTT